MIDAAPATKKAALMTIARALSNRGDGSFSLADLVVKTHEQYPGLISLPGYPQYPDSHLVRGLLDGGPGLVGTGRLLRDKETGRLRLGAEPPPNAHGAPPTASPSDPNADDAEEYDAVQLREISRLQQTWAYRYLVGRLPAGQDRPLSFRDAWDFWRATEARDVHSRLCRTEQFLATRGSPEVRALYAVHNQLLVRFAPQLRLLETRYDKEAS